MAGPNHIYSKKTNSLDAKKDLLGSAAVDGSLTSNMISRATMSQTVSSSSSSAKPGQFNQPPPPMSNLEHSKEMKNLKGKLEKSLSLDFEISDRKPPENGSFEEQWNMRVSKRVKYAGGKLHKISPIKRKNMQRKYPSVLQPMTKSIRRIKQNLADDSDPGTSEMLNERLITSSIKNLAHSRLCFKKDILSKRSDSEEWEIQSNPSPERTSFDGQLLDINQTNVERNKKRRLSIDTDQYSYSIKKSKQTQNTLSAHDDLSQPVRGRKLKRSATRPRSSLTSWSSTASSPEFQHFFESLDNSPKKDRASYKMDWRMSDYEKFSSDDGDGFESSSYY